MDLGKDQSHLKLHQTLDPRPEETTAPEVIGTWSLRNREQLKKRKADAQEKQTSQWLLGEHKKHKRQRTGKGNQRGRKRQQNAEPKVEPRLQIEKEMIEKALVSTENETESPGNVTEALHLVASPPKVVLAGDSSEICQESITHQENSSEYQEITAKNHSSETCQHMSEPQDLSSKMCLEIAIPQDHPFKMCQDMVEPEVLSPKMCQETDVLQNHSSKVCQDIAEPEVLSPKMCQETAISKAFPSTSEDIVDLEGCSPRASPKPDVPQGYPLDTCQNPTGQEEFTSEPDQGEAENESFFPQTQEIAAPEHLSMKTYQETVEPEYFSHETYKEIIVSKISSHKTMPEAPGPEEYSPEAYQETPEPEDLSTKMYKNGDVPKECLPELYGEVGGPQGQDPKAHQEDAKDVDNFTQEMKEKTKAEEPEIPEIPHVPQEIPPENDIYSYVLF